MSSATHAGRWAAASALERTAEGAAEDRPPHRIVFEASEPESGPPVRIYLGTEPAQYRAERIFIWSVDRVRSPSRRYEITLLRDLPGYDRLGWTTGFTNHRFAIPHYAGGAGRAIYNDTDQIYLRDPAELFDLDLGSHGYLAIAERETSVMLLDCERMASIWTLHDAQHRSKRTLIRKALAVPGLWGDLDGGWNCRDEDEYSVETASCYHFTTLHTQPWRPFPDRFVYHEHPHGHLWWDLKASADAAGYRVFDRTQPTARYRKAFDASGPVRPLDVYADRLESLVRRTGSRSLRCFGGGERSPSLDPALPDGIDRLPRADLRALDGAGEPETADAVVCVEGLDELAHDDVPWVIGELFRRAERTVLLVARRHRPRRRAPWHPPEGEVGGRVWWLDQVELASREHPGIEWELVLEGPEGGSRELHRGGPWSADTPPRVWLVSDDTPGAAAQARSLGRALGWPCREVPLEFAGSDRWLASMVGPGAWSEWAGRRPAGLPDDARAGSEGPDLILAAGNRTAPAARALRDAAGRPCRVVQIDCDSATPADDFDCVATRASVGALAHPRRAVIAGPLCDGPASELPDWLESWVAAAGEADAWLMVDADLPVEAIGGLVETVLKQCAETGRRLGVSLHRDSSASLVRAARAFSAEARMLSPWSTSEADPAEWAAALSRPERLMLASHDAVLAVAARISGRPVQWWPVPRPERRSLRDWLVARAFAKPENDRGTTRPQMGIERWFSWLVARGVLLPAPRPDLDVERLQAEDGQGLHDLERLSGRIRAWFAPR